MPTEERFLNSKEELKGQIATLLGGRSAEEVVFGKILADFNIPHLFQALHLVFALVAFGVLVNLFLNLKISK